MRYKAFISYSHAADGQLAPALQHALQQFARPWLQRRVIDIFRDQTSLTLSPALWPSIERALEQCEHFVLLASPDAAASPGVGREIEWWLAHRDAGQLLIVLTDGELCWHEAGQCFDAVRSDALPPPLRTAFTEEPLWLDLRWARGPRDAFSADPRFVDAIGELSAALRGRAKDELVGEDLRQHRKRLRLAWSAAGALASFALAAGVAAWLAVEQRERALAARDRGEELI